MKMKRSILFWICSPPIVFVELFIISPMDRLVKLFAATINWFEDWCFKETNEQRQAELEELLAACEDLIGWESLAPQATRETARAAIAKARGSMSE